MSDVTYNRKRYVHVCAGCNLLNMSGRGDKMTCDGRCRVRAHRSGRLKVIRQTAQLLDIEPATILQAAAVARLRPDLEAQVRAGAITLEDAMPDTCNAFLKLLQEQLSGPSEDSEAA